MKKLLIFIGIASIGFAAFSGCKKSSSNTAMKATINGSSFGGPTVFFSMDTLNGKPTLEIEGGNFSTTTSYTPPLISLEIANYEPGVIGTYSINDTTFEAYYDSTTSVHLMATSGTISITTSNSSTIKGTFNFTCVDGTAVTNGSFTASPN